MVNGAVNIGWGSFDLAETLKKELDLPVTVKAGNDANVAALGEMWQGGGKRLFQPGSRYLRNRCRRRYHY